MDDQANHPFQGPHWRARLAATPPEFTPLHLVVEGGEARIVVDQPEMIAGRHSDVDIRLPLPDVSRRHCRFTWDAGRWQVFDLGSLNGLWVNDRNVQQAYLEQGDRVRIGGFAFVVHLTVEAAEPAEPSLYRIFRTLPRSTPPPRRLAS